MATNGKDRYQIEQRKETLEAVDAAIETLQRLGISLTYTAIAKEAGLSTKTVTKDAVKAHILGIVKDFGRKSDDDINAEAQEQITILKDKNEQLQKRLNEMTRKYNSALADRNEFEKKYRILLMKYAIKNDSNIIQI